MITQPATRYRALAIVALSVTTCAAAEQNTSTDVGKTIEAIRQLGGTVWHGPKDSPLHDTVTVDPGFSDAALKEAVGHLRKLPNLRTLSLNFSRVTDDGIASLRDLPQLRRLSLKVTNVTDDGLKHLEEMPWLREIDLTLARVSDTGVAPLKKALPDAKITYCGMGKPAGETKKLRGTWRGKRIMPRGMNEEKHEQTLVVAGNDLSLGIEILRFTLDPSASPKRIDAEVTDCLPGLNTPWGRYLGIYRLDGDTLTLCLSPIYGDRKSRPRRFSPDELDGWMYVFERVQDDGGDVELKAAP